MDCVTSVEILSAELDGAATAEERRRARLHLDGCASCRDWYREATALTRAVRVMPAEPGPDVTEAVLPALRPSRLDRLRGAEGRPLRLGVRWLLVLVALLQLGTAVLYLTGAEVRVLPGAAHDTVAHVDHETGAWNAALAVALLWVALRSRHAAAQLPVLASFTAALGGLCLLDLLTDRVGLARVLSHVPVLLGLALVAVLAVLRGPEGFPGTPEAGHAGAAPDEDGEPGIVPGPAEDAESEDPGSSPVAHRASA
ncbi:Predicted anti-sigma-YlaC factor YlaD, contains Zn-finger domain [Actinopolyspora saharensis]|uniref:Predicted anti-sigma-YlaC factor YlaD, contains Zn-finger domain n=1 Tax=Actinopolyspora saharensis TaxID=995062 RepID=A0A1H1ESF9_9ACTN|nr:Predicted anti-sigma-YlaC factor YlaD, contains Zn-finger domain [Actinopolyspora saharensis]